MKSCSRVVLAVAAGVSGAALAAGAAGAPSYTVKSVRPHGVVVALALNGNRVAFSNGPRIVVWNLQTGGTVRLSAQFDHGSTELAIAGPRVAWINHSGGNLEADDDLYTASLTKPAAQRVAEEVRSGAQCGAGRGGYQPACAGTWLGGLIGSGSRILVNRWTTTTTGAISNAGLYTLNESKFNSVTTGPATVEAVAADLARVAVLQWRWHPPGNTVRIYSSTGRHLSDMTPKSQLGIAISGHNLAVLEQQGYLALYNADTGSLRRTFNLHARELPKNERPSGNPRWLQALAVQGNVAVYSKPVRYTQTGNPRVSAIHALNLSSGKDRVIGRTPGQIPLARMDSLGLVYSAQADGYGHNSIVFVPLSQIAAAVS